MAASLTALIMVRSLSAAEPATAETAAPDGDAPTELPKVKVQTDRFKAISSPKFTQPLRDTPQTIIAIPNTVYQQQGATTLSDVLRNTAGITFAAGEGGSAASTAGDSFYLRGFDTSNSIFVDGVRDVGAYSRDIFNYDQVEIAKGPAGADIGRGGASGYINLATKVPRLDNFVTGSVSFGFDDGTSGTRRRTTLDLDETLPDASVKGAAFRLNAVWQDSDVPGRDYANNQTRGIAPSLALGLGTPTRAYFTLQHVKQDNLPDYGLPSPLFPGYVATPAVPAVDWSTFYGLTADFDHVENNALEARFEHDFTPDVKLTNQTRYSQVEREAVVTTPGSNAAAYVPATGLLTRSRQANTRDTDILSNQTNVVTAFDTGILHHDFTGGLEIASENAYSPAFVSVVETPIPVANPNPNAVPTGTPARSGAYTQVNLKTAALYGFDTIHFNDHWEASLSLRGEEYKNHTLSVAPPVAPAILEAEHGMISWKTGLIYKPVKAGTLYVAYSNSLTPPSTDFTVSTVAGNQNNPDTGPQKTTSLEVGAKWDFFSGRLLATAAVFKTVNDQTVFTDPILGLIPTGKQTVQGLELGATRRITDNWLILGSFAFLDSEIDNGLTAGNNPAGASLPLIPKYSGSLWTSYRFKSGIILGGGTQYMGAVNRRDATVSPAPRTMPGYWLWNALASYPLGQHFTLRLNVNNVFSEKYVQSYNNNGARFSPGAPRTYLVSADFKF
jgi:catecholate siderophore receptor